MPLFSRTTESYEILTTDWGSDRSRYSSPQGKKGSFGLSVFWARAAARNFSRIQLFAVGPSLVRNSSKSNCDLRRLNASSICHRTGYNLWACRAESLSAVKSVKVEWTTPFLRKAMIRPSTHALACFRLQPFFASSAGTGISTFHWVPLLRVMAHAALWSS